MSPPPVHATLEEALRDLRSRRSDLNSIEIEQWRLVLVLEATTGREELDNVRRMVAAEAESGSIEEHRAVIKAVVQTASSQEIRVKEAREAIRNLGERLHRTPP